MKILMPNNYQLMTYSKNGAWGLKGASLMSCPPTIYGACAKLYDLESLCVKAAESKTREDALAALQRLLDIGLGARCVEINKMLGVKP